MALAILTLGGRLAMAIHAVQGAAAEAARAASISRTAGDASSAAMRGADAMLANSSLNCATRSVIVDTSGFGLPVGTPANVEATVECDVALEDLTLVPGMPSTHRVSATMVSPLDTYRGRS